MCLRRLVNLESVLAYSSTGRSSINFLTSSVVRVVSPQSCIHKILGSNPQDDGDLYFNNTNNENNNKLPYREIMD